MGIGAQELLLLACCGALPLIGGVVVLLLVRGQSKKGARSRPDDWDYSDDDR